MAGEDKRTLRPTGESMPTCRSVVLSLAAQYNYLQDLKKHTGIWASSPGLLVQISGIELRHQNFVDVSQVVLVCK